MAATFSWAVEPANNNTPVSVNIEFQPSGSEVPRRTLGGGSRGNINFMPSDDKAPNKPYQWLVILLKPGEILRPDAYSISGWVKRVSAPVTPETLKGKNPGESQRAIALAALYAKSGIWYDTLNILNQARLTQPENLLLKKEWADLLKQVGLEHLAQESLTEQL
ncbi:MAG: DUF928 domain-containing protein [Phormidium sp.]